MKKKQSHRIGSIKPSDIKVRKKHAPPTQVQTSQKDYDRKRVKEQTREEVDDE